jgi:hypothetical protein
MQRSERLLVRIGSLMGDQSAGSAEFSLAQDGVLGGQDKRRPVPQGRHMK